MPGESDAVDGAEAEGQGVVEGEAAPVGDTIALLDAETEALALPMLLIEGGALDVTVEEGVAAPVAENGADGDEDTVGELVPPPAGDGVPMLLSLLVGDAEGAWEEERLPEGLEETLGDRVPDTE